MLSSSSAYIAEKCFKNVWLSWDQELKLIRDVKLFGTTIFVFPCWSNLATLLNFAMLPSEAKEGIFVRNNSSRPFVNLYPSSVLLSTWTIKSVSLGTIPVGKMLKILVAEMYSLANLRSSLTLELKFPYFSSLRSMSVLDVWYSSVWGELVSVLIKAQEQYFV